ncbi:SND1 family protein [Megaselia abdita]
MASPAPTSAQQPAATPAPQVLRGIVKQVVSGDTVVIRGQPKGGPPPEKQITFSYVSAPKLARRPTANGEETRDEPFAWEAREALRKRLIGEEVVFTFEKPANSNREYGVVYLGKDIATGENVVEYMVSEGYLNVRKESRSSELTRLIELEEAAKSAGKGKWNQSSQSSDHVRQIKWSQENPAQVVEHYGGRPVKAIVEHVRDGSTIRAFLVPDFYHITLMISGIRCPGVKLDADGKPDLSVKVPFADEARYFVESRLLQREIEIRLESVNNANFVGTILYPKGNIAEALLREGFAKCVDWSMAFMKSGADKLRAAERQAKEKRLRLWKDYQSNAQQFSGKEKDFTGTVVEVYNGDAISVKTQNGAIKKVFLSSVRPPREAGRVADEDGKLPPRPKNFRPLYDIPWMFEAREFLRKKLINKKVTCNLDYITEARDNFPEKYCYTVTFGGQNIAEAMVQKGLATLVKYRQDDDKRSSKYDDLLTAEAQAIKGQKGLHSKKDRPTIRINDLTVDHSRIKHQYLPSWTRALRSEACVEFVASGSRVRLYMPKESCLVTFLLGGISCPRSSRPAINGAPAVEGEPFGDEALTFTKDRVLQRDVQVDIETTDRQATSVIGWLYIDGVNLSVSLVEEGLAEVHFSAEKSTHFRALKSAEEAAKKAKKGIWANYVEQVEEKPVTNNNVEEKEDTKTSERKVNYESVIITEITPELHFFSQNVNDGTALETLMGKLRSEFQNNPPISGAYTPKRGDLVAAQFQEDKQWYRAKVEKVQKGLAHVCYIDYGNKEAVPFARVAAIPPSVSSPKPFAVEYVLAFCQLPPDSDDKDDALRALADDVLNRKVQINIESHRRNTNNLPEATLHHADTKVDVGKALISEGLLIVENRSERRLKEIIGEYKEAEASARKEHLGIWQYGDVTQDDAPEFSR